MLSDTFNASAASASTAKPVDVTVPPVPWGPWLGVLFAAFVYFASQIFGGLLLSIYPALRHWTQAQATDWAQNTVWAQFVFVLLAETFTIGSIYLFLKRYRAKFRDIGLKRPRWSDPFYGLLAVPVYFFIYGITVALISHFVPGLNVNERQQLGFNDVQGTLQLVITFISLVILPPIAEEIMVRGFLYSTLKKALPTIWAVLLTSALFAMAHLPEGGSAGPLYIAAIDTFVLSLILIYLREQTGSLWASITLHASKNGIAFLFLFVLHVH